MPAGCVCCKYGFPMTIPFIPIIIIPIGWFIIFMYGNMGFPCIGGIIIPSISLCGGNPGRGCWWCCCWAPIICICCSIGFIGFGRPMFGIVIGAGADAAGGPIPLGISGFDFLVGAGEDSSSEESAPPPPRLGFFPDRISSSWSFASASGIPSMP